METGILLGLYRGLGFRGVGSRVRGYYKDPFFDSLLTWGKEIAAINPKPSEPLTLAFGPLL